MSNNEMLNNKEMIKNWSEKFAEAKVKLQNYEIYYYSVNRYNMSIEDHKKLEVEYNLLRHDFHLAQNNLEKAVRYISEQQFHLKPKKGASDEKKA
ncbi:hypothetical protein [uncultured Mediterranean phage uvMED]|nr:hypothetical protein [uncultured Mediterranean phage uvMED]